MNEWAALTIIIGCSVLTALGAGGVWVVKEIKGVLDPKPDDTYTEWARPFIRSARWVWWLLVAAAVLLIVLGLFGVGAVVWFTWFHI